MNDKNHWDEFIDRHLRGELNESEKEGLAELLDSNADARQDFVQHAQWDTEFAEALRESSQSSHDANVLAVQQTADGQWASKPSVLRPMLAIAAVVIMALSAGLIYQLASPQTGTPETDVATAPRASDMSIARITGLSGSLIWTGDRGQIVRELKVGEELAGGTIEGMAPDSWFELQFNDGSTVMISGTSMLTFADLGQKELRLREGTFSANVMPQPNGKPMLIHTPSTLLKILGTQFDVKANLASTMLNVTEGKVRMKRLSDGREVDVPAKHRVIAEGSGELSLQSLPESVDHWNSQLHLKPGSYGKWLPAMQGRAAVQKAIPLVPPDNPNATLHLLAISVSRHNDPPVVVRPDSRFVVRGRLDKPARVYFGIAVSDSAGEFAGKFRGDFAEKQPMSKPDKNGEFEVVFRIRDFTLDPCVRDREQDLAVRPDDLVLGSVWVFTHTGSPSGLEVSEVELLPPE